MREDPQMMQEYLDEVNHDLEEFLCTTLEGYQINNILLRSSDAPVPRGQQLDFEETYRLGSPAPTQRFVERVVTVARNMGQDIQWGLGGVVWGYRPRVVVDHDDVCMMFGSAFFVDHREYREIIEVESNWLITDNHRLRREISAQEAMTNVNEMVRRTNKKNMSPVGAWNA